MDKIGFVILHYLVVEETIACVDSIMKKFDSPNYEIIIVDNASPNESGKELQEIYNKVENIHVILNKENEGFSKGNNKGYKFAKEILGCNYIIMSNNDVLIMSSNIYERIKNDYTEYHAAVVGPKIYTFGDQIGIQNPQWKAAKSDKERMIKLKKKKRDLQIAINLTYVDADLVFYKLKSKIGKILKKRNRPNMKIFETLQKNVQLHGCFLAFTPEYVKRYDGIEEITFMYHEEMILARRMELDNQIMVYDPEIKIFHAEKVATNCMAKKLSASRRIRYKRELASVSRVIAFLNKEDGSREG